MLKNLVKENGRNVLNLLIVITQESKSEKDGRKC